MARNGPQPPPAQQVDRTMFINGLALRANQFVQDFFGLVFTENFEHFIYHVRIPSASADANTPAGTTLQAGLRISSESHFICTAIQVGARIGSAHGTAADRGRVVTGPAVGPTSGDLPDAPFLLQITDGGSDRLIHNEPVDAGLAYSTAGRSQIPLARPRKFQANSNITITAILLKQVQNAAGAACIWDLRVQLFGYKLYLPAQ